MLHGARGRGTLPVQRGGGAVPAGRGGGGGRRARGRGPAPGRGGRRAVPVGPVDVRTHVTDVSTADVSTPGASTPDVSAALGTDFVGIAAEFGDEERDYLQGTRAFVDDEVLPG